MRSEDSHVIDEDLADLEHKLQRLKVEYDQFFLGSIRREPSQLRSEVQRTITRYVNEPPRNSMQKFRFNTLTSRFQALRSLWGRTLREIEAGTYKGHRFRLAMQRKQQESAVAQGETQPNAQPEGPPDARPAGAVDRLLDALVSARQRTGEQAPLDRARLESLVRKQSAELKRKHPGKRVSFRVVIEDNRARLKASVRSAEPAR